MVNKSREPSPDRVKKVGVFLGVYKPALERALAEYPGEYAFKPAEIPRVLENMKLAFEYGSYNIDGRAIKAACKTLSITHSRRGMEAYFNGT